MSKKYVAIGDGEQCPKCQSPMERREHDTIREKQKNAPYYFKTWDYCWKCHHLQHYEWAKVMNNNASAKLYKQNSQLFDELKERDDLRWIK